MQSRLALFRAFIAHRRNPLSALGILLLTCSISACSSSAVVAALPPSNQSIPATREIESNVPVVETVRATGAPQLVLSFVSPTPTDTPTVTPTPSPTNTPLPATPTVNPTYTPTPEPPTLTPGPGSRSAQVPILLYHYIRPYPDRAADPLGYNLSVPPERFEQQLAYLAGQGYTTIRIVDLASHLRTGQPRLPPKPIILTFDDAYDNAYTQVLPILRKYGMIGTFFIPTGFVDRELSGYMNWAQVKALYDAGMEIGAHTVNHVDLTVKTATLAEQEIAQSRQMLEDKLGDTVHVFAFPYGRSNARVEQIAARYFLAAANSNPGVRQSSDTLYQLRRITANGSWGFNDFVYFMNYWINSGK